MPSWPLLSVWGRWISPLVVVGVVVSLLVVSGTALGGVDGDGEADIVFANLGDQRNRVCLGDGLGGFTCSEVNSDTDSNADVGLGDVNGDGDLDAVFATYGRNQVCLGNGTGGFVCSDVSTDSDMTDGVSLGDVNGDGNLDAVFANFGVDVNGERNKVCLGDGTGGFTCGDMNTDSNASVDVMLGDVNGDGNPDAVFANIGVNVSGGRNRVCLGDGTGGFVCSDVSADTNTSSDVGLGDFNGDGDLDAVFVNNTNRERICVGDGSGGFTCSDVSTNDIGAGGIGSGDVNGDGDLDILLVGLLVGPNQVCLGDGSGGFTCGDISSHLGSANVAVGDVDRDGDLDAAFARLGEPNLVCLGDASGGFACSEVSADVNETHGVAIAPGSRGTFIDDDDSIFESDIEWLVDQGITQGCSIDGPLYCPDDNVTRGQMAAFLARAFNLPDAGPSPFTDTTGSIFETDIAKVAAAGITQGCNPEGTLFCPNGLVTRGQMAAFLSRALVLPDGAVNTFVDDDGSIFEVDIAKIAQAGITQGCTADGTMFCPDDFVDRGQMAAFIHRAFE